MTVEEHVSLASRTSLRVGGAAHFFITAESEQDALDAIVFAREQALPLFLLGEGTNILVPDTGVDGVVLHYTGRAITIQDEGSTVLLSAEAGAKWDVAVDAAAACGLFGIETLAGIPGSVGGAAVQNIGAYGSEFSETFAYADTIDLATGEQQRVTKADGMFAYRTSIFKTHPTCLITRITLRLGKHPQPKELYADLARAKAEGVPLSTPRDRANAVRAIRAQKFPNGKDEGTAGSFFKNPILSQEEFAALALRYPGLPSFPYATGAVKIPLAWILDHVLALKGFSRGFVRVYEKQPLVLVTTVGARANDVDALANDIAVRVYAATGITIEREVETFGAAK